MNTGETICAAGRNNQQGFTLIELMVTVLIAAILGTLAAPALQDMVLRSRMTSVGSQFTGHILRARNEAISRNICSLMCLSTSTSTSITTDSSGNVNAGPTCDNTGSDWQSGWIVFLKEDCSNTTSSADSMPVKPEDYIIIRPPADSSIKLPGIPSNTAPTRLFFDALGRPTQQSNTALPNPTEFDLVYINATNAGTRKFGFNVCVDLLGRTRTISSSLSC